MTAYVGALFAVTDPAALHVLNRWLLRSRLARGSFFRSLYLGFHPVPQITQSLQQHSDPSTYPLRKSATAKKKIQQGYPGAPPQLVAFPHLFPIEPLKHTCHPPCHYTSIRRTPLLIAHHEQRRFFVLKIQTNV